MTARPINRDRLAKVLALLSSPVDGEALAATRKVVALLAAAGMRPEELIDGVATSYSQRAAPFAATPTPRRPNVKPRSPSVRDLGPAALRRVLDDLLAAQPFPLLPKHAIFVRAIRDRLYREPHLGLSTGEVRRLNELWRVWRDVQTRAAA